MEQETGRITMDEQIVAALLDDVRRLMAGQGTREEKLTAVCRLLQDKVEHYDWVGFYLVDETAARRLVLGPFVGDPTDHVAINFGQGICGQAAEIGQTFVVQDVMAEINYLSCSDSVKAEIVVPIFKDGHIVGELDIDSHTLAPFSAEDRALLEQICEQVAESF